MWRFLASVLLSCGKDDPPEAVEPVTYPLTSEPFTALQAVWAPKVPSPDTVLAIASGELAVDEIDRFEEMGLGVELQAGLPWVLHDDLAPDFPTPGPNRRSLAYLWQAADPQLIDEESPIRLESYWPLYRPQGHITAQVFEAHVRSAQRISDVSGRPFDFALLAGDLTDGGQWNELEWTMVALTGGVLDPDSGADDDPVAGAGNDHSDPFVSDGLLAPWYAALGNHETLYNGGFDVVTEALREASTGERIYDFLPGSNGYRDGSTPNGDVVTEGTTIADEARLVLYTEEVLDRIESADGEPSGHGLTPDDVAAGRGYFSTHPIAGAPLRLIVLNTVNHEGEFAELQLGAIDLDQWAWLLAEIALADELHEIAIVMSHHRADDLASDGPVSDDELTAALAESESVVLHVAGHGHRNRIDPYVAPKKAGDGKGYWELMLASTVDFPMQSRILELVDEDNGYLTIYATNLDHNTDVGSLAHTSRALAAGKLAFPDLLGETSDVAALWETDVKYQDMVLRVPISEAIRTNLAAHDWPSRIESEETLPALEGP